MKNKIIKILVSIAIPLIVGFLGSYFTIESINNWYININKPSFNPPNWIFGPVWTILYILIGISYFLVWEKGFGENKNKVKFVYFIQLFFNFTWSISFFYLQSPLLGLINIIILWLTIIYNIILFYKVEKVSGIIITPYLIWVSFATLLNIMIYLLN